MADRVYQFRNNFGRGPAEVFYTTGASGQKIAVPHVVKHSPDGFAWGYAGSGPTDCARSILLEAYGVEFAERFAPPVSLIYLHFKWQVIASLPRGDAELPGALIDRWVKDWKVK